MPQNPTEPPPENGPRQDQATFTPAQTIFLRELDRWVELHGDAFVPQKGVTTTSDGTEYRLGLRVMQARTDHKRGTLPEALRVELEARRGWQWNADAARAEAQWQLHFAELTAHLAAGLPLEDLPEHLARWLARQRLLLAAGQLAPGRRQKLEAAPQALQIASTGVPLFVRAARAWLEQEQDRTMAQMRWADTVTLDGAIVRVGRQATYYRRRFAGLEGRGNLTPDDMATIEQLPGWTWTLDERRSSRARNAHRSTADAGAPAIAHSNLL